MLKMDPKMGTHFGTHFGHLVLLCCPKHALGAKMIPKATQEPPGPVQPSIFTDLGSILRVFW